MVQETRLWDEGKQLTRSMRSKEGSSDYRDLPEPDLGPIEVTPAQRRPGGPSCRSCRPPSGTATPSLLGSVDHARVLTDERPMAEYFEAAVAAGAIPRPWPTGSPATSRPTSMPTGWR